MLVVLGAKYCVNQHIAHVNFSYAPINHLLHDVCTCSWSRVMQNWLAADFVTALRVTYNLQVNKTDLCMADYMFNDRMWVWQYCYGYGSEKVGGGGGWWLPVPQILLPMVHQSVLVSQPTLSRVEVLGRRTFFKWFILMFVLQWTTSLHLEPGCG